MHVDIPNMWSRCHVTQTFLFRSLKNFRAQIVSVDLFFFLLSFFGDSSPSPSGSRLLSMLYCREMSDRHSGIWVAIQGR